MKSTVRRITLGLIVLFLFLATGYCRFSGTAKGTVKETSNKENYCVGVEHPDSKLGLVCTTHPSEVMSDAVSLLGIPKDCLDVSLPSDLSSASHITLTSSNGKCAMIRLGRLNGKMRLLAGGMINANTDSASDLTLLPGIGEVKARRIVENREIEGPFQDSYDLIRVKGIGEKTANKLDPWLEW